MKPLKTTLALAIALLPGCCSVQQPAALQPLPVLETCEGQTNLTRFDSDGHMYSTFLVATIAELPPDQVYALTYYSQLPDLDCRFDATHVSVVYTFLPWHWFDWRWRDDITGELHSLHGGNNAEVQCRRYCLGELIRRKMINPTPESLQEAGLMIHAFGDSYAHTKGAYNRGSEKAYGTLYGHALAGHRPDQVAHPEVFPKYAAYVRHLFQVLDTNHKPESKKLMEDYLCSLSSYYVCTNECCDSKRVETMERAITTWSLLIRPGFSRKKFDEFLRGPRLTRDQVQKVMNEIKRGPY